MAISLEQLVAGALFLWGKIDCLDLSLLINYVKSISKCEFKMSKIEYISSYIEFDYEYILIKEALIKERLSLNMIFSDGESLKDKLEKMAGPRVIDFLNKLDLREFVLRKIAFCFKQKKKLELTDWEEKISEKLYNQGLIASMDTEVELTPKGLVYLFMMGHAEEINILRAKINSLGICADGLWDYFLTIDDIINYELADGDVSNYIRFMFKKEKEMRN